VKGVGETKKGRECRFYNLGAFLVWGHCDPGVFWFGAFCPVFGPSSVPNFTLIDEGSGNISPDIQILSKLRFFGGIFASQWQQNFLIHGLVRNRRLSIYSHCLTGQISF